VIGPEAFVLIFLVFVVGGLAQAIGAIVYLVVGRTAGGAP
jgi:hypothetical protein